MQQAAASGNTRLPDFLLVVAAKSATSSMYSCLDQHWQTAMASKKQGWSVIFYRNPPKYKSSGGSSDIVSELDEYLKLCGGGAGDDQFPGGACPSNLYTYEDTINSIRELYPERALARRKIIISLRQPVSRAFSRYDTFTSRVEESLGFEQAVVPETIDQRMLEGWDIFYDYLDFGMFSEHVVVFQRSFGKDRLLVPLVEDIHADIQQTCRRIYRFLGVDADVVVDNRHKHNRLTAEPKINWLVAGMFSQNRWRRRIAALIPEKLRIMIAFRVLKAQLRREILNSHLRQRLHEYFDADIARLERLIVRALSA